MTSKVLASRLIQVWSYDASRLTVSLTHVSACSSSLVALHLACNTLRLGESKMALVGGSNLILSHEPMLALSMLRYVFYLVESSSTSLIFLGYFLPMVDATCMTKEQMDLVVAKE